MMPHAVHGVSERLCLIGRKKHYILKEPLLGAFFQGYEMCHVIVGDLLLL